jgi:SAM-dependent methyltransferase
MLGNNTVKSTREQMLQINVRQKAFYEDARFASPQASSTDTVRVAELPTRLWSWLRNRIQVWRESSGVNEHISDLHRQWMNDLKDACVLDLGCFTGNNLSLWIAEHCADYTGIDLSETAIAQLDAKLRERELLHARAYAQDFLANTYPDDHFDLIYACSVLHHFKDRTTLLKELRRVLKPGGLIISIDPLMTEPLNRLTRAVYRPFQVDRDWEWPFTYSTFRLLRQYFEIEDMQGAIGMSKLSLPFYLIPGLSKLGQVFGDWGAMFDNKYARKPGLPFFLCWMVTLCLRKPGKQ